MSKEMQIEEIANVLYDSDNKRNVVICGIEQVAEDIYNAGYRKQSEVVRCKECEHFYQDGNVKICRHWNCHSTEDDAYCSFAKMKGGE